MTHGKLRDMMFLEWISADMSSVPISEKNLPVPLGNPCSILLYFISKETVIIVSMFACILSLKLVLGLFLSAYLERT